MKAFALILLTLTLQSATAQYSKHIIQLTNKNNNPYSLTHPSDYLSPKAIERRSKQNIAIDSTDLPVNPAYLDSIRSAGDVVVLNTSRWLNHVLIETTDAVALAKINQFSFVKTVTPAAPRKASAKINPRTDLQPVRKQKRVQDAGNLLDYGSTAGQVNIHEGAFLHNKGLRGEGMVIAMLDAGYYQYDTNPAFDSIRLNNQVLDTWDFVKNKRSVAEEHMHGAVCLSTMAANSPGKLVGTAPKAKYYLFRTEDADSEHQIEEQNWVAAAERADSLGVDIISSSLGYYEFDDESRSYSYSNMDGQTAIITRGAEAAFSKGIIVCNSAGNSGQSAWRYIIAPADGKNVLAIGAVNVNGLVGAFSSYGPSSDGRIKPDVASVGEAAAVAGTDGNPAYVNGTSLACPNLAGLITCLWQAFPEMSNADITDAIKRSAERYTTPNDRVGYGIPNMRVAYEILSGKKDAARTGKILGTNWIKAYPVPFASHLNVLIKAPHTAKATLMLLNSSGKEVLTKKLSVQEGTMYYEQLQPVNELSNGIYWLQYRDGKNIQVLKLVK